MSSRSLNESLSSKDSFRRSRTSYPTPSTRNSSTRFGSRANAFTKRRRIRVRGELSERFQANATSRDAEDEFLSVIRDHHHCRARLCFRRGQPAPKAVARCLARAEAVRLKPSLHRPKLVRRPCPEMQRSAAL